MTAKRVLEKPRQLGVTVRHMRRRAALCAVSERIDTVGERKQRAVDVSTYRVKQQPAASGACPAQALGG